MMSLFNLLYFHDFHVFSLFNLLFFHIFPIISPFNLLFFHIFPIFSLFNLLFFHIFYLISQFSSKIFVVTLDHYLIYQWNFFFISSSFFLMNDKKKIFEQLTFFNKKHKLHGNWIYFLHFNFMLFNVVFNSHREFGTMIYLLILFFKLFLN